MSQPPPERPGEGPPGPGRARRSVFRTIVEWALTVLVTVFILRRVGIDLSSLREVETLPLEISLLPLAGSVGVLALGYAVSAALWGRMVREMGGPALPPRTSVPLFMVANLGRYVPGKVLQIAGLTWLAGRRGVSPAVAAGAAILGQGVALLGATVVGLAAFFSPALDPGLRRWGWIGCGAVGIFVVATAIPGVRDRARSLWARLASSRTGPPPAPPGGAGFGLRWTALYTANWSLYAAAFWLLALGLVGWHPFLYVGPAFAAAYVGGYLALFAPAGLGVREGLLAAFLAPVLEPETALGLAVAARLWTTGVEVIPAGLLARSVLRPRGDSGVRGSEPSDTLESAGFQDEGRLR